MRARGASPGSRRKAIKTLTGAADASERSVNGQERAFLVSVAVRGEPYSFSPEESLDELERLAQTAGIQVVGRELQNLDAIKSGTYIGTGKVETIRQICDAEELDMVIFDDELSPAQLRTLESEIGVRIIDRTALILDIFALHARTREGALQVALAQYSYRLPRLTRMWTHLSRQGVGGVGLRGPGETQLELDRREISRRMAQIREELDQVRKQRSSQRRRRRRQGLPVVSIVGYTNAGKSTLLNRLSGADVLVEDKLFATLDPTTRRVDLETGKEVLFTDTVGFIQKLPTQLVAAFRATLEEVLEADILLLVADISDPNLVAKVDAVDDVLAEIGAADKPTILVLNKIDLVDLEEDFYLVPNRFVGASTRFDSLRARYDRISLVSAEQGVGIEELLASVEDLISDQMVELSALLPYAQGELLNEWHKHGLVESETFTGKGVLISGRVPRGLAGSLEEFAVTGQ